jgi:hypothetical protein
MKPLTQKDLPALASLIRYATHLRVDVFTKERCLEMTRNNGIIVKVKITLKGKVLATDIITGFYMRSHNGSWKWEIVI